MIVFPNCKINLGLKIIAKRADGFHDLETVFYPVALKDAMELMHNTTRINEIEFTGTGLTVGGNAADNLCVKAYQLLKKDLPQLPPVKIHLHKAIPMGAGLGGGSADAAFMLKALNDKFRLGISQPQLIQYALQLGSDCPFFIKNKPCFASGRGEILEEISVDLSGYKIILVNPGIHINTGWAFSNIRPAPSVRSVKEIIQQPLDSWRTELENDFEVPVFIAHPEIKEIKGSLYRQGAIYASMSGSGSTVFGVFSKERFIENNYPTHYFTKIL